MKKSFYSALGCSIYKSTFSPRALSKIYWTIAIAKLLYGSEVRYFHNDELKLYESHHRLMAKSFLRLRKNAPDAFCLSAIGWDSLEMHIDKIKLELMY